MVILCMSVLSIIFLTLSNVIINVINLFLLVYFILKRSGFIDCVLKIYCRALYCIGENVLLVKSIKLFILETFFFIILPKCPNDHRYINYNYL